MDKYHYRYERTSDYCYPNSDTLINKLGIKDEKVLNQYERKLVAIRQAELLTNPMKGNLDFEHLKAIHKYLFQDLYHWAGEIRTCDIAKRDLFCLSQYIESYAEDVFKVLIKKNYFISLVYDDKLDALVSLFGDINALHPFREGNGRTQREFINMIARINGLNISFVNIQTDEMIEASHLINNGHEKMLKDLFSKNIEKISYKEQQIYIKKYIRSKVIQNKLLELIEE